MTLTANRQRYANVLLQNSGQIPTGTVVPIQSSPIRSCVGASHRARCTVARLSAPSLIALPALGTASTDGDAHAGATHICSPACTSGASAFTWSHDDFDFCPRLVSKEERAVIDILRGVDLLVGAGDARSRRSDCLTGTVETVEYWLIKNGLTTSSARLRRRGG